MKTPQPKTTPEILELMRAELAAGRRIFTPLWTHCHGRTSTTQAIRQLHKAGEITRAADGSAHWEPTPAPEPLKIFDERPCE